MNSLVYIVMPCYNGEKYLLEQLMSIYYQNYTNWYLIFVNDWSTDNSENILRNWISHYNLHDKVDIINKENGGVCSAIQRWLEEIKSMCDINNDNNLVAYCDADDVWTREKLEVQVEYMNTCLECWMSYHDMFVINENSKLEKISLHNNHYKDESFFSLICYNIHFYSTEIMFRVRYINDILPFPIWKFFSQDHWTALILSLLWVKIWYIDKQLAYYRSWHESLSKKRYQWNNWQAKQWLWYIESIKDKNIWVNISYEERYFKDRIQRQKKWYSAIKIRFLTMIKYPKVFILVLKALFIKKKLFNFIMLYIH